MADDRSRFLQALKLSGEGTPLDTNDFEFFTTNVDKFDAGARLAATHRHDGQTVASPDAPADPSLSLTSDVDGAFPGDATVHYRISKIASGIESPASTVATITTPGSLPSPTDPPTIAVAATGGELVAGLYGYAYTFWRSLFTFETKPSAGAYANLPVSGGDTQVAQLEFPELPEGADGINIYRRLPNSTTWNLLVSIPAAEVDDGYLDDGTVTADAERLMPGPNQDFSADSNSITITPPGALAPDEAWRLYRTFGEDVDDLSWGDSLIAELDSSDPWEDLGAPTGGGTPILAAFEFTNPNPIDLPTESAGVLPPERVATNFIYNSAGARTANRHNDWAELMAALAFLPEPGRRIIFEQPETIGTEGMPTDGWHFHGAAFAADAINALNPVLITFDDGAKLDPAGFAGLIVDGGVRLYSASEDPVVSYTSSVILRVQQGQVMSKTEAFFHFDDAAGAFIVSLAMGGTIGRPSDAGMMDGSYESIDIAAVGFGLIICQEGAGIFNDIVRGDGANLTLQLDASRGDNPEQGHTQTNLTGGWESIQHIDSADGVRLDNANPDHWTEGLPTLVADAIHKLAARGLGGSGERVAGAVAVGAPRNRTINVDTTDTSTTITVDDPSFTDADVGAGIAGDGIDPGTTIASVTSPVEVELSAPATATAADVEVAITPSLGTADVAAVHADTPAAGYAAVVGTGADNVEVLLPPPGTSPALDIMVSTGDNSPMSGAAPYTFVALNAEFVFTIGTPDLTIPATAFRAIPLRAGEDTYGWAIIQITPEPAAASGGGLAGYETVTPASDVYDLASRVAAGVDSLACLFPGGTDPVEIQLPIASATEGKAFTIALAYSGMPSAITWTMDGDTITPIILGTVDLGSQLGEIYPVNAFTAHPWSTDDGATYTWLLTPLGSPVNDIFHGGRVVKPTADLDVGTFTDIDITDPDGSSTLATVARSGRVGMIALVVDSGSPLFGFWIITASGPCTYLGHAAKGQLIYLNSVSDALRPWIVARKLGETGGVENGYGWINP